MALLTCPECARVISDRAATCPGCGNPVTKSTAAPAAPGGVPAPSSDVDSAAAKKKRFWRTTLADLAREGAAKNTSFGRKLWIAVCVAFPALYAALTIAKLT